LLVVSGKGAAPTVVDQYAGSILIAGDDAIAARVTGGQLDDVLREAIGGGRAIVWVDADSRITALPLDESGMLRGEIRFPLKDGTIAVPAGTTIDALSVEGSDAGTIRFSTVVNVSDATPSIRYFFPDAKSADTIDALYFNIFAPGQSVALNLSVSLDPSRPLDGARNVARVATNEGGVTTYFCTPMGVQLSLATTASSKFGNAFDPVTQKKYLVLEGDWQIFGPSGPSSGVELLLGLSGSEFATVNPPWLLNFVPNGPAFAPNFGKTGREPFGLTDSGAGPNPVTTSWVYVVPPPDGPGGGIAPAYYSQPNLAPYFAEPFSPTWPFVLDTVDIPTAEFPIGATGVFGPTMASFPMAPYAGIDTDASGPGWLATAQLFESTVLNPARSTALFTMNENVGASGAGDTTGTVTSPQGLLATFSDGAWNSLRLATSGGGNEILQLTSIYGDVREVLMSSQPFLVVSYPVLLSGLQQISIAGWTFELNTSMWIPAKDPATDLTQTVMIMKFCDQDFETVVNDLSRWSLPAQFNLDPEKIQSQLQNFIAEARKEAATQPDLAYFVETVLATGSAGWNGILFLNAPVPADAFPPALRGLAAGLPATLPAHHLGINVSPFQVNENGITTGQSSLFGLILYDDRRDLTPPVGVPYDFKVLSLHVLFENSAVAAFSSQIELYVGQLFGEVATLKSAHTNNIILDGVWQRHGSSDSFTFTFSGENRYAMTSKVLANVIVDGAQFLTLPEDGANPDVVSSLFIFDGTIQFDELMEFDLFSFGADKGAKDSQDGLNFSNLYVTMSFDETARTRSFEFLAGDMAFDSGSVARPQSLYANFPLQLTAMHQSGLLYPGATGASGPALFGSGSGVVTTPGALGFLPVQSPLTSGPLGEVWFGMEMALNLGSPGALAPKLPFTASILASWAPSANVPNVAVGLRLPDSDGGKKSITLQGPLKLSIGDIAFYQNNAEYMLSFTNIALQFLSLSFPQSGQTNAMLFCDPNRTTGSPSLGWYAAYKKKDDSSGNGNGNSSTGRL
jgi:hypothetical protein